MSHSSLHGLISMPNFSQSLTMISSHFAWITKAAYASNGVFYKLHMTSLPPFRAVYLGMSQAGDTQQDVPIIIHKSALSQFVKPASNSSVGRFSPKLIMESSKSPLHSGSSHYLPVLWSLTFWAFLTLKSLMYYHWHLLHFSKFVFPCSSAILWAGMPDFQCNPSTFWDIRNFRKLASIMPTNPMWHRVGKALAIVVLRVAFVPYLPLLAAFSQHPGPVGKTVSIPDQ